MLKIVENFFKSREQTTFLSKISHFDLQKLFFQEQIWHKNGDSRFGFWKTVSGKTGNLIIHVVHLYYMRFFEFRKLLPLPSRLALTSTLYQKRKTQASKSLL